MILATYTKQPADTLDYDLDYTDWLSEGDTIASATETTDVAGLTILAPMTISGGTAVKLWVSGGTDGSTYKITVTTTTNGGRVKQDEIKIKVKDY